MPMHDEYRWHPGTKSPLPTSPAKPHGRNLRSFTLFRGWDATGISGTGTVAEGVQFSDGSCVLRWLTEHKSTALYDSIGEIEHIHGHGGATRVEWDI